MKVIRMLSVPAVLLVACLLPSAASAQASAEGAPGCPPLLDHSLRPLGESEPVSLCDYAGQVVMLVNTASRCAFTPQYEALEQLYRDYRDRGVVVLGFPSNDFGNQEPGSEAEIKSFCELTYEVGFPMFEKTRAARGQADPLYQGLAEAAGSYPSWNFHKYVLGRDGALAGQFGSRVSPADPRVLALIESLL